MLFQRVQNFFRVAVLIPAVEGQVDHFFAGVAQIIGVVLRQVRHTGIPHRGLALGLEGEAPVVHGGRHSGLSGRRHSGLHLVFLRAEHAHNGHAQHQQCDSGSIPAFLTHLSDTSCDKIHCPHLAQPPGNYAEPYPKFFRHFSGGTASWKLSQVCSAASTSAQV